MRHPLGTVWKRRCRLGERELDWGSAVLAGFWLMLTQPGAGLPGLETQLCYLPAMYAGDPKNLGFIY